MKTVARMVALPIAALLLVGCGTDESNDGEQTSSTASSSTSTSSSPSATTSSTSSATAAPSENAEPAAQLVECIYGGGSWTGNGDFSDGSYGPHPECQAKRDAQLAENPYVCPQTDWHVPDPSWCTDTSKGGRLPGGEAPIPAPAPEPVDKYPVYDSSGEAQTHHGCQQGYIDDPALCAEMEQKYG